MRFFVLICFFFLSFFSQAASEELVVGSNSPGTPFPHFWEHIFGSGRAILSLRHNFHRDLQSVHSLTDASYIRFHHILSDEVGFYTKDHHGKDVWNYSYINQIYDGLLDSGLKPFVELSFMPTHMAADHRMTHGFWFKPNISPPADYGRWEDLIRRFADHLVTRYGIDEVATWYFEVWNEPNLGFWGGMPNQPTYYELYEHTARALKAVNKRLRVGGPSTAQAAWIGDFLSYMKRNDVPVDFASTHIYANDSSENVFGLHRNVTRENMVCRAIGKVHDEIVNSPLPRTPLIISEFNASYANEPDVTDTVYMGPWIANTIRECAGLVEEMSYWSFTDVFEEQGVKQKPFYGGFGLLAEDNIQKPALNAFALLHRLGNEQIQLKSDSALATRRADGKIVVALWNYAPPNGVGQHYHPHAGGAGPNRHFTLRFDGLTKDADVRISRVDAEHGNVLKTFDSMGRPSFPTRAQFKELRQAAVLPVPVDTRLRDGILDIDVPVHGIALIEIGR